MRRALLLLVACALGACETAEYDLDGGSGSDGNVAVGRIELLSERSLALVFNEGSELDVRYEEEGRPVRGVPIRFALEGRAHDSTLSELLVATGEDGRARASLVAASTAAVFRVRISTERSAPVYVNVSVGNMGFGGLRVAVGYMGDREITRRVIRLYSELTCADELPAGSDRSVTIDLPGDDEVRFTALPAGLQYAVVGRALGPSDAVLAAGCVDGVGVVRDRESQVTLELRDERLLVSGLYETTLEVNASVSAHAAAEVASSSAAAELAVSGSGAELYLDAVEAELRERGDTTLADDLAERRRNGVPEISLEARLDDAEVDFEAALSALEARLTQPLSAFTLDGPLSVELDEENDSPHAVWTNPTIQFRAHDPESGAITLPSESLGFSASLSLRWREADAGALELDAMQVQLPLGTLAASVLEASARELGLASPGLLLAEEAGCDVFVQWVTEDEALGEACDDECAEAACARGLDRLIDAARAGLMEMDATRSALELSGVVTLLDENANTYVDRLEAELEGLWTSPLDEAGDPVEAQLKGVRVLE